MEPYAANGHKFLYLSRGACSVCSLVIADHDICYLCGILLGKGHLYDQPLIWNKPIWVYDEYPKEKQQIMNQLGIRQDDGEIIISNPYAIRQDAHLKALYSVLTVGWTGKRRLINKERKRLKICFGCHEELSSGERDRVFDQVYGEGMDGGMDEAQRYIKKHLENEAKMIEQNSL